MDPIVLLAAGAGIYAVLGLATFGFLMRNGGRHRMRQCLAAAVWPIYWPVYQGLPTIGAMLEPLLFDLYVLVGLFFPAYYLFHHWHVCEGLQCAAIVVKAVLWAPFWPAYAFASLL